jgi:uncharacterized membrane protein
MGKSREVHKVLNEKTSHKGEVRISFRLPFPTSWFLCGLALAPFGSGCRGGHRASSLTPLSMIIQIFVIATILQNGSSQAGS